QPGITLNYMCVSSTHRDTFTTSHIVKEQPILRSLGNAKCKRSSLKRLHLANQSKVPGSGGG
ncbi:hypothetical protein VSR17_30875, partial [Cupriavidus taiwanensis]|uniref:hypothetical protein n=1 Tax=Cupriavidus taiwanensis TaxID=164546 RepID=UPI00316C187A